SRYPFNGWLSKRFSIVEPHVFGLMLAVFQAVTYGLFSYTAVLEARGFKPIFLIKKIIFCWL
ncbi:MAG: hypothetical protein ACK5SD_16685, partial [Pseudanabaena sp.]